MYYKPSEVRVLEKNGRVDPKVGQKQAFPLLCQKDGEAKEWISRSRPLGDLQTWSMVTWVTLDDMPKRFPETDLDLDNREYRKKRHISGAREADVRLIASF